VEGSDEVRLLPIEEYRQTWSEDLDIDPAVLESAARIQAQTELLDVSGEVVATRLEDVQLEGDDDLDIGISRVNLGETGRGDVKMSTWTASNGDAASLQVQVTDTETGEVALSTLDEAPVRTVRAFSSSTTFDDDSQGYIYLVLLDLIGANGDPIGEQHEVELLASPDLGPDGIYGEEYFGFFGDGQGAVAMIPSEDGFDVEVLWQGDGVGEVESVNVIFEEPFEGPAPLELEVQTQLVGQFDKWVQKGGTPTPSSSIVGAVLADEIGQILEEISTSGGGDGTVYRTEGNGKGTKKSNIKFPFIPRELL
jgi:hypothetical protein